jgi:hypothetical protein
MFLIDHSEDGREFNEIHREAGQGDVSHTSYYEYVHTEPLSGWNYYRLTQVDFSGEQEELGIKAIWFDADSEVQVFPNPVSDVLSIQGVKEQIWTIRLYDSTGRLVNSHTSFGTLVEMEMSSVPAGVYHLQIENLVENLSLKIIKN